MGWTLNLGTRASACWMIGLLIGLDLIEQIWDSLPEQVEPQDIHDWHLAEFAVRRARAADEPGAGQPWREVLERLEGGL